MQEKIQASTHAVFSLTDRLLWIAIGLFLLSTAARNLISDEPFCLKKFTGEMLFSVVGGFIVYAAGLIQHMSPIEILFFASLASLGGIRLIEWMVKIAKLAKGV